MMGGLHVIAKIGGRQAAIPGSVVQSVVELGAVVPVPLAPPHVSGLTALRSRALTVIDTRAALGLSPADWPSEGRAAVVEVEGHAYALLVDQIEDVAAADGQPVPSEASLGPAWDRVATGLIDTSAGPAVLVDVTAFISSPPTIVAQAA
jgi:purine-binding chemotaxis protein CheW